MTEPIPSEATSLDGDAAGGPAYTPRHLLEDASEDSAAKRKRRSARRNLIEWVLVIGGALLIALFVRTFLVQTFYIPSGSMEPTLQVGDRVLVNKLSYEWGEIKPGQIVVFDRPGGPSPDGIDVLIKRVIGVEGDVIEGRDGHVWRNDEELDENYLPEGSKTLDFGPETVPEDSLWLMGDNRNNSEDSRVFGPIPEGDVVGRAFVIIWPLGDIGWL